MADTEREAFEAWARDPIRAEKLPLDRWPTNDGYKDTRTYIAFYGWKSGRAALASRPAEVDDEGLPALPPEAARASKGQGQFYMKWSETGKDLRGELLLFTAEQYRQGQRDAVAADRALRGNGWISVKDHMPTDPVIKFLVTGVALNSGPLGVHMAELRGGSLYFHEGDMKGGCDPCIDDVVTHWMPLPSAPSHTASKEAG